MDSVPWLVDLTLIATPGHAFTYQHEQQIKSISPDLFPDVRSRTATHLAVRLRVFAESEAKAREGAERIIERLIPREFWTIAKAIALRDITPPLEKADAADDDDGA